MSAILQALNTGYSAQQVLSYLAQHNPKLSQQITSALNAGHTIDHVLNFISKNEKRIGKLVPEKEKPNRSSNLYKTSQTEIHPALTGAAKFAGTTAAVAGGSYALARAIPSILRNGLSSMPSSPTAPQMPGKPQNTNTVPNQPIANGANAQNSVNQQIPTQIQPQQQQTQTVYNNIQPQNGTQQPPISPSITQPASIPQPELKTINAIEILNKYDLKGTVDNLIASGNDSDKISAYFKHFKPSDVKKLEKDAGQSIEKIMEQYMQESLRNEAMQPEGSIPKPNQSITSNQSEEKIPKIDPSSLKVDDAFQTGKDETATLTQINDKTFEYKTDKGVRSGPLSSLEYEIKPDQKVSTGEPKEKIENVPIAKNETVATPHGIGEVKSDIRNGYAIVEVDGKKHKMNIDDVIQSPLPEKELADLYDDLISGIEKHTEKEISKHVEWAGFDPKTNELAYRPHGAAVYVYDNIQPQDAEFLTSMLTKRKTTGENHIGVWEKGTESPIGAAMHKLIEKLKEERGKGNEYKNKYATLYDAIEPARTASKLRYKQREKDARPQKPKKAKKPRTD